MRTGNAGGLEITVDGKPTASIGPNGAVRRTSRSNRRRCSPERSTAEG